MAPGGWPPRPWVSNFLNYCISIYLIWLPPSISDSASPSLRVIPTSGVAPFLLSLRVVPTSGVVPFLHSGLSPLPGLSLSNSLNKLSLGTCVREGEAWRYMYFWGIKTSLYWVAQPSQNWYIKPMTWDTKYRYKYSKKVSIQGFSIFPGHQCPKWHTGQ